MTPAQHVSKPTVLPDDSTLVRNLRAGDESAFVTLLGAYEKSMLRIAALYVRDDTVAEEVVQDTWIAALQGLDRFEGRSSLKTWLFSILVNRAKTRAQREGRSVPMSALAGDDPDAALPAVDPDRFYPPSHPRRPGGWATPPHNWDELPEDRLLAQETTEIIRRAIEKLSPGQREVITLRDVEGWSSDEVCNILGLSESNQRVLLHRARSAVRRALEIYLDEPDQVTR